MSKKIILQILISTLRVIGVTLLLLATIYMIYHVQGFYIDGFITELENGLAFNSDKPMENAAWLIQRLFFLLPVPILALIQMLPYIWTMKKRPSVGHLEKAIEAVFMSLLFVLGIVVSFVMAFAMPDIMDWLKSVRPSFIGAVTAEPEMLLDTMMWLVIQLIGCIIWMSYHFARYRYFAHPREDVLEAEKAADEQPDVDELGEEFENRISKKVLKYLEFSKDKDKDAHEGGRKNKK